MCGNRPTSLSVVTLTVKTAGGHVILPTESH